MILRNNKINGRPTFFYRLAFISLIAVYFLILVGGIVRSTGSGMGCPDWPKCFGQWVPPSDVSELPVDYKEKYQEKRIDKNVKLAKYLHLLGMEDKAKQVVEEGSVKEEQDFNKYKTWTEYINRVVGAVIGLLVMATFITSIKYFKTKPELFWTALAVLFLTGFTGWLGSLVVSTNLLPWMVTVHMMISFFIVAGLIYLVFKSSPDRKNIVAAPKYIYLILGLCIVSLVVQVIYGTQVRESVDTIALALQFSLRDTWISQLDWQFYFHRSFSWIVLLLHIWLLILLFRSGEKFWSIALMAAILISIVTGVLMSYFAIPPVLQPVHLLLSVIVFGIQYYIFLMLRDGMKSEVVREG